jgi:hypothetical protein
MTCILNANACNGPGQTLTGNFSAAGQGAAVDVSGRFNITLWGSFAATVQIERSFDGGLNWHPCTFSDGTANTWTAPISIVADEPEAGVRYRLACTSYTSGTVNYRVSQ